MMIKLTRQNELGDLQMLTSADKGGGGGGSQSPHFWLTYFVTSPLCLLMCFPLIFLQTVSEKDFFLLQFQM